MSITYKHACLAFVVSLLPFFLLDRAVGEDDAGNKRRVVRPRGLEYCIVRDLICSHKSYLRPSFVAERLSEDGMLNSEMWGDMGRITQKTFRECFGTLKEHEAILAALRIEGAANADIQKISELSNLKELILEECQADDLSPLLKLKKLETLCIHRPNMGQLRNEKLLQTMGRLRNVQLIAVPNLQEAIDLPLPPVATLSDNGYGDEGLRSIRVHTPTWDGKAITIPEHLKHLDLLFACGQKGYACLSSPGAKIWVPPDSSRWCGPRRPILEMRVPPRSAEEVNDSVRKLVHDSGLLDIPAFKEGTQLLILRTGCDDQVIDLSPLKAFSRLKYLTIDTGGKYTGFADLDELPLKSICFDTPELYGPSEKNIKNLELHPTLAQLEHNFYSASCVLSINRLRINAMCAETDEGKSLPSNMVAIELNQPNAINFETGESPKESRWERQDYAYWLGVQGNRTKASEITGEYDPKKTKDPDIGLFIWSDSDKNELTGRREYRHRGASLKGGKQKYSESVWRIDPVIREDRWRPVYTRTVYVEALSPGDYEVRWMVRDRSTDTFLEPKSDKITIRVEEKDGKLHAWALPKGKR